MTTWDDIERLTRLPKNDTSSIKVSVQHNKKQKKSTKMIRVPPRPRNGDLICYEDDVHEPSEPVNYDNKSYPHAAGIISHVLQSYGRQVPTNNTIEEVVKTRQKRYAERIRKSTESSTSSTTDDSQDTSSSSASTSYTKSPKTDSQNHSLDRKNHSLLYPNSWNKENNTKEQSKYNAFPKNILMRSLLEMKMDGMKINSDDISSISSGKNDDSDCKTSSHEYVEMPDDLDVLLRPEMMNRGIIEFNGKIDNSYRFEHHGIKETVTPRRYMMDSIDDDDFVFKKKA